MRVFTVFFLTLSAWHWHCSGAHNAQKEQRILEKILGDEYQAHIRPFGYKDQGPVNASTNMYIRSISGIDDVNMEYDIQLTFRQEWHDGRLNYRSLLNSTDNLMYVTVTHPEKVWSPDVFFSNEKSGHFHNIIKPNILMRIFPEGDVLYSTRISLKLSCTMDLHRYPMDKQTCFVILASYGYTTEDIVFTWRTDSPIQLQKNLNLPTFTFSDFRTDYCTSKTSTGEYTCLKLELDFTRQLNYYMLQVYIPFIFLVILSWIPFWLDYRVTTARVAIWITILLAMLIMTSSLQIKLPAVSYTKAIDVWTGICISFIFAVVIELAYVTQAAIDEEEALKHANAALGTDDQNAKDVLMSIDDYTENSTHKGWKFGKISKWLKKYPSKVQRIDVISRVCFPLAFMIFNVFYWSSYA